MRGHMKMWGRYFTKTKSLDGTKPYIKIKTNRKAKPNPNTNPIQLFYAFFEHHPLIFNLALVCPAH